MIHARNRRRGRSSTRGPTEPRRYIEAEKRERWKIETCSISKDITICHAKCKYFTKNTLDYVSILRKRQLTIVKLCPNRQGFIDFSMMRVLCWVKIFVVVECNTCPETNKHENHLNWVFTQRAVVKSQFQSQQILQQLLSFVIMLLSGAMWALDTMI